MLTLATSRPREGLAQARAVLASRPEPLEASVAHHAAGVVLREFGDVDAGVRELRAALRSARQAEAGEREADVLAALGVALVYAGRTNAGLAAFDQAGGSSVASRPPGSCSAGPSSCGRWAAIPRRSAT